MRIYQRKGHFSEIEQLMTSRLIIYTIYFEYFYLDILQKFKDFSHSINI